MSFKTIFIIIITALITVILMNNTEEIDFWLFGNTRIPKLVILGCIFVTGFIVGFLAGRPRKKTPAIPADDLQKSQNPQPENIIRHQLSDEDREYIE